MFPSRFAFLCAAALPWLGAGTALEAEPAPSAGERLHAVADFADRQATGVTVSSDGRVFVCFPRWSPNLAMSVGEVYPDGTLQPFPNERWNEWEPGTDDPNRFVCVQSVVVAPDGRLFALDPASPFMEGVVERGARLFGFNLDERVPDGAYGFPDDIAPKNSYLNDVRFDPGMTHAYITDSGTGALVVLDLESGESRRVLAQHSSTQAEDVTPVIGGRPFVVSETGETPKIHADGIAISEDGETLFFHALTAYHLYAIPTAKLKDFSLSEDELAAAVRDLGETHVTDGMHRGTAALGGADAILHTALEKDAITAWSPGTGAMSTVLQDPRLIWPDTLAVGPDGSLFITAAQIHNAPRFNEGENRRIHPYVLWRLAPGEEF
ncbi:MAG: L-dopachrome tautomerase-related protein [Sumerlaeia bacterium]